MSKVERIKNVLDPENERVTWSHSRTDPLTIRLSDVNEEHRDAARDWFTVKGMQVHLEQRTSQDMENGAEAALAARHELWKAICEKGHLVKKVRVGGIFVVAPEIEAVAKIKGVSVSVIQVKKREMDDETWKKIISNPKVKALAEEIRAEREADETDFDDLLEEEEDES